IQRKMSMKLVQSLRWFPMQDEHEIEEDGVGVARPGASAHEKCREPEPGTDPGVSAVEPTNRVCGGWARGEVRLGGRGVKKADLRGVGQTTTGCGASVCGKGDRAERVADDAIDPQICGPIRPAGSPRARISS